MKNKAYKKLQKMTTKLDQSEIRRRLAKVDVVVFDVDGCLYPGYTQIELGHLIFSNLIRRGWRKRSTISLMIRMSFMGAVMHLIKRCPLEPERRNLILQRNYTRAFRGVSKEELTSLVPEVWKKLSPNVESCIDFLSQHVPLGIISLGLDVILDGLSSKLAENKRSIPFLFCYSNKTIWENGRFNGLEEPVRVGTKDKESLFIEASRRYNIDTPLVIGHNAEERGLCRLADQRGGLSIGLGAEGRDQGNFHVCFQKADWSSLESFLRTHWPH